MSKDHNEAADVDVLTPFCQRCQVCFWAGSLPLGQSQWEDLAEAALCRARYAGPHVPLPPWWFCCPMYMYIMDDMHLMYVYVYHCISHTYDDLDHQKTWVSSSLSYCRTAIAKVGHLFCSISFLAWAGFQHQPGPGRAKSFHVIPCHSCRASSLRAFTFNLHILPMHWLSSDYEGAKELGVPIFPTKIPF